MNTRRAIRWLIEPDPTDETNDFYDLKHGNRPVLMGRSMREVTKYIRKNRAPGETVYQMDGDLSVQDITRNFEPRAGAVANPRRTRLGFTLFRRP